MIVGATAAESSLARAMATKDSAAQVALHWKTSKKRGCLMW